MSVIRSIGSVSVHRFASILLTAWCSCALASTPLTGLGLLPDGTPSGASGAFDMSADGSTVVKRNFRHIGSWTTITPLPGQTFSALATSGDGLVVVGTNVATVGIQQSSVVWRAEAGGTFYTLETAASTPFGPLARFANTSGDVVLTEGVNLSQGGVYRRRYTWDGTTYVTGNFAFSDPMGFDPGEADELRYRGISDNGSAALGINLGGAGEIFANRMSMQSGPVFNRPASVASATATSFSRELVTPTAISGNGLVIIGTYDWNYFGSPASTGVQPFRWSNGTTTLMPGMPLGSEMDFDGEYTAAGNVIYHAPTAISHPVATFLQTNGIDITGWTNLVCTEVSSDGFTFAGVGTRGGVSEIWKASIAPPPPPTVCHEWMSNEVGNGVNGPVYAVAEFNGSIYVGGEFTAAGSTRVSNLARWTGSQWQDVAGGTDGPVYALQVFDEDASGLNPPRLFVGGRFESVGSGAGTGHTNGSVMASNIARFDGTNFSPVIDSGTVPGSSYFLGLNGPCYAMLVDSTVVPSRLVAGGNFNAANDSQSLVDGPIVFWTGSAWQSSGAFFGMTSCGANCSRSDQIQLPNVVLPDRSVRALAMFNGRLYAGGQLRVTVGAVSGTQAAQNILENQLIVRNPDPSTGGHIWQSAVSAFATSGLTFQQNPATNRNIINALAVYGNRLIVGGSFQATVASNTLGVPFQARNILSFDGTAGYAIESSTLGPSEIGGISDGEVRALLDDFGNGLVIGGSFSRVDGTIPTSNMLRLFGWFLQPTPTCTNWTPGTTFWVSTADMFSNVGACVPTGGGKGTDGPVYALAPVGTVLASNNTRGVIVGGQFTRGGDVPASNVALWGVSDNPNIIINPVVSPCGGGGVTPTEWRTLGSNSFLAVRGSAGRMVKWRDRLVVAGVGEYNLNCAYGNGTSTVSGVAAWNGVAWEPMDAGVATSIMPAELVVMPDPLGGTLERLIAIPTSTGSIREWNGSAWVSLGAFGVNGSVNSAVYFNGLVYIAGVFNELNSNVGYTNVAALNIGASSYTTQSQSFVVGPPYSLFSTTVGRIGVHQGRLLVSGIELFAGGGLLTQLLPNSGGLPPLPVIPAGALPSQAGANAFIAAFASDGEDLYIGGNFTSMNVGPSVNKIARMHAPSSGINSPWSALGSGVGPAVLPSCNGIIPNPAVIKAFDDSIFIGGDFLDVGGLTGANGIARWDPIAQGWAIINNTSNQLGLMPCLLGGSDCQDRVLSLEEFHGFLYVGGRFCTAGGYPSRTLARLRRVDCNQTGPVFMTASGQPRPVTTYVGTTAFFDVTPQGQGPFVYQWKRGNADLPEGDAYQGTRSSQLAILEADEFDASGTYRCFISNGLGSVFSQSATLTLLPQPACDSIDFNRNTVFPEDQDVIDFFTVLAGGPCSPGNVCNDIDFNNNTVFPEDQDVIDFFNVLAGGTCP